MRVGCIYKITNQINNKIYIGQTVQDLNRRFRQHITMDFKKNYYLGKAINKYGESNFKIEVIENCEESVLDEKEIEYIRLFNSSDPKIGYNTSLGGRTPKKRFPETDIEYIKDLYVNKHWSLHKIAEQVGNITWHRVQVLLTANGVEIRDRHDFGKKYEISTKEIEEALSKYKTLRKAAKSLGVSYSAFRKQCLRRNIEYNSPKSTRQPKG